MAVLDKNVEILRMLAFMEPSSGKRDWKFLAKHYFAYAVLAWNAYTMPIGVPMFAYLHGEHDIGLVYEAAGNILSVVEVDAKMLTLLLRKRRLAELIQTARNCSSGFECPTDEYTTGILSRAEKACHFLTVTLVKFTILCYSLALGIAAVIFFVNEIDFEIQTTCWYPFDVNAPFVLQFFGVFLLTSIIHSTVMAFEAIALISSMLINTVAQLQIINHKLANLRATAEQNVDKELAKSMRESKECAKESHGDSVAVSIGQVGGFGRIRNETQFKHKATPSTLPNAGLRKSRLDDRRRQALVEAEMQRLMKDCVDHHCEILRFVHEFEEMFSGVFCAVLLCNLIANVLVLLSSSLDNVAGLSVLLPRIFYFLLQLAIFCFLGHRVLEESGKIGTSISQSDWLESSDSFKRSMRIVMAMGNQPIVIKAAGFVPLSFETFGSVLQTSYSYYTVLSSLT